MAATKKNNAVIRIGSMSFCRLAWVVAIAHPDVNNINSATSLRAVKPYLIYAKSLKSAINHMPILKPSNSIACFFVFSKSMAEAMDRRIVT